MSFDNPLDADRTLHAAGCSCGQHLTQADHDLAASGSSDARLSRVVESAVVRALFPEDHEPPRLPARGRRLDGAGGDLAVLPARHGHGGLRPGRRAREEGPQGRLHPHHLRHADHHGAPDGLLHQARPQRGGGEDRRLGRDPRQDAEQGIRRGAHALADAAGDHAGRRLQPDPLHHAGGGEHQRPGHHACHQAQGQARSRRPGRASSSPCRSTIRCTTICCATTWPSTASIPTPTSRSAPCRRRRWWPTCAPTTSTASSAPDPVNQRAVYDGVGFIHMLSKEIWDRHPCCAFAASQGVRHADAQHLRRAAEGDHRRHGVRGQAREPQADRGGHRAGQLSEPAGDGGGAGADRHLRRRPGQRAARCPTASISIPSPGSRSRCGS